MVELGDLREGVMGDDLVDFYEKVFRLPNIKVIGLGANLNCLHGVMPNQDKLVQLCLYKQIIELKFGREIPWISGGTTVTLPLMLQGRLPKGINHFRVGEALFFGKNLFTGHTIEGMYDDVFELFAEVIDVTRKPAVPHGDFGENPYGDTAEVDESLYGQENVRAILDVGTLDISPQYLLPRNQRLEIGGASSDMLILDLGEQNKENLRVGDYIRFRLKYMGALHLLKSKYIGKEVTESDPEALASGAEAATEDVINELSMEEGVRE
jgi:predicted amino acid racemase